jgi:hypothetical protein
VGTAALRTAMAAAIALAVCCAPAIQPDPGTFVEEFDGFPIFHGDPGRPYRVLGRVYAAEAAARGTSPMKRAAVAAARRLGADAIVIGVPIDIAGTAVEPPPEAIRDDGGDTTADPEEKWQAAVAIDLLE